jgi:hypothetical protein
VAFYIFRADNGSMIVLLLLLRLEEVEIAQRCPETNQDCNDCDKNVCSVASVLLEHGVIVCPQMYQKYTK